MSKGKLIYQPIRKAKTGVEGEDLRQKMHASKQTFDHLESENSLTEIARCPYINGETQYAHSHHGFMASKGGQFYNI